jgi:hypothetical protein
MVKGSGRNANEVERIIADFERSGMKRREYCEVHGIALPTLDWYRRRVHASRSSAGLVPVKIENSAMPSPATGTAPQGFTLVLGNGSRIETGWNFDGDQLARLIRIAGSE